MTVAGHKMQCGEFFAPILSLQNLREITLTRAGSIPELTISQGTTVSKFCLQIPNQKVSQFHNKKNLFCKKSKQKILKIQKRLLGCTLIVNEGLLKFSRIKSTHFILQWFRFFVMKILV